MEKLLVQVKMGIGLVLVSLSIFSLSGGVHADEAQVDEKLKAQKEDREDKPTWVPMTSQELMKVPGESAGQLSPGRQSSVAAGLQFKLDKPEKKKPKTSPTPAPTPLPQS